MYFTCEARECHPHTSRLYTMVPRDEAVQVICGTIIKLKFGNSIQISGNSHHIITQTYECMLSSTKIPSGCSMRPTVKFLLHLSFLHRSVGQDKTSCVPKNKCHTVGLYEFGCKHKEQKLPLMKTFAYLVKTSPKP